MSDNSPILIERSDGSTTLYIIFGGIVAGMGMPPFEFVRASNTIDENRIFIRDFSQSWYQNGLQGISDSIEETSQYLRGLISKISPTKIVLIGNSMGGFAAILFAQKLQADKAIAFSPQTSIKLTHKLSWLDFRWMDKILRSIFSSRHKHPVLDLKHHLQNHALGSKTKVEIHVSNTEKRDLRNAYHLKGVPGVSITEYPFGGHSLVKELRDKGLLAGIFSSSE